MRPGDTWGVEEGTTTTTSGHWSRRRGARQTHRRWEDSQGRLGRQTCMELEMQNNDASEHRKRLVRRTHLRLWWTPLGMLRRRGTE